MVIVGWLARPISRGGEEEADSINPRLPSTSVDWHIVVLCTFTNRLIPNSSLYWGREVCPCLRSIAKHCANNVITYLYRLSVRVLHHVYSHSWLFDLQSSSCSPVEVNTLELSNTLICHGTRPSFLMQLVLSALSLNPSTELGICSILVWHEAGAELCLVLT